MKTGLCFQVEWHFLLDFELTNTFCLLVSFKHKKIPQVQSRKPFFLVKAYDPCEKLRIIYNYPLKGRWIVVDIYWDAKRRGIYPPLFIDPGGDSCFSIYQIRWIKKRFFNFFYWNFREMMHHFCLPLQNSEYPRIFRVMGANHNAQKLVNTTLIW